MKLINILFSLINVSLFIYVNSFDTGLWRGTTHYYIKSNNQIDLKKPVITMRNYTQPYYFNRTLANNKFLKLKLQSYDKLGGVIVNLNKNTENTYYFTNQINFFYNTFRSVITINYTYNKEQKLELTSIIVSGLRCGLQRRLTSKFRPSLNNLTVLNDKLKTWTYCKSTIINPKEPYIKNIKEINCYDYEYMLLNKNRISKIFIDNLIISLPEIIDDNKPFSLLIGCLISNDCYKQVNLNYNFNGYLTSFEYNEYEPYNFTSKINNILNLFKKKLLSIN